MKREEKNMLPSIETNELKHSLDNGKEMRLVVLIMSIYLVKINFRIGLFWQDVNRKWQEMKH